jgi:hypothetical protein
MNRVIHLVPGRRDRRHADAAIGRLLETDIPLLGTTFSDMVRRAGRDPREAAITAARVSRQRAEGLFLGLMALARPTRLDAGDLLPTAARLAAVLHP